MAFQFSISPGKPKAKVARAEPNKECIQIPCLSLAPFTTNVKLCFENVLVGTFSTQKLLLINPYSRSIELSIKHIPLPERRVQLSWQQHLIPANETILLEITWAPIAEEAWRHTFIFEDGRHVKKDVAVTFKSIIEKKNKCLKSKQGKISVVSKKIKIPSKRMSPKSSLHKYQDLLPKQKVSPPRRKLSSLRKASEYDTFTLKNKENVDPCKKGNSTMSRFLNNDSELFLSPHANTFNIDSKDDEIRRGTFTVKYAEPLYMNEPSRCYSKNISNDSLEMEEHLTTLNIKNGNLSSYKQPSVTFQLQSTPQILKDIKELNLESSLLAFTPIIKTTDFSPSLHSTSQKSNSTAKQLFDTSQSVYATKINSTENVLNIGDPLANVSTETYVKGNISSETYTLKGNLSSSTYIKDNSVDNSRNASIRGGNTINNIASGFNLSPILKDSSIIRQANMSGDNIRNVIEANLWCYEEKRKLDFIDEEAVEDLTPTKLNLTQPVKRKSTSIFDVSLPKKIVLENPKRVSEHCPILKWNKTKIVQNKQNLHRSIEYIDPFMAARVYQDQQWMAEQEIRFKKWLNALLTPPAELDSNIDGHPVDVAKLWQQCKHKSVPIAPSKEVVSSQYHTNNRLNLLRKAASKLFKSQEVVTVLDKALKTVECGKLSIRTDKQIHLDLGLQSEVMTLFLSYNPLWLRIGLETVYGTKIALTSNSDIMGLSNFIMERFFKDPFLIKKYKSVQSEKYVVDIKKFILKKFLVLVYFLDVAKSKVLIAHDPCLFCKNAPVKESREILLRFSRELISAIGDVTKFLRFTGYAVSHKQKYIHEFDYSVINLGVDLRDGVRLTKVMEIILLQTGLTDSLRVPAISKLQKNHNMKIVFDSLQQANFQMVGDISYKDIVDGHHEKTLSFLWQIIYKFHAPLLAKASVTIQTWWRSLPIVIKRRILYKRYCLLEAIIKIQSYIRMWIVKTSYLKLRVTVIRIQELYRATRLMKREQNKYIKFKATVIFIQRQFRATMAMNRKRRQFLEIKSAVIIIQRHFRAHRAGKMERHYFIELKNTVIRLQRQFRANHAMNVEQTKFQELRKATVIIQRQFRARRVMIIERNKFLNLKNSVVVIQRKFRAHITMQVERATFQELKQATLVLQSRYRAHRAKVLDRNQFVYLKKFVIVVQRRFRANVAMPVERAKFQELKQAILVLQSRYRAHRAKVLDRNQFVQLKKSAIMVQRRFRANMAMRVERAKFQQLKQATLVLQSRYRAHRAKVLDRNQFVQLKKSAIMIQRRFRANMAMRVERAKFQELKQATLVLQSRYRAHRAKAFERNQFVQLKKSAIMIQRRFRANMAMRVERAKFQLLKQATLVLQSRYRAHRAKVLDRNQFVQLKKSAIMVQRRFRANMAMRVERAKFQELKQATLVLQSRYRAHRAKAFERNQFVHLKKSVIVVQRRFRTNMAMRIERAKFQELKQATLVLQSRYRAHRAKVLDRNQFVQLKKSAIMIQRRFRANMAMRVERAKFQQLKQATLVLQSRYRAHRAKAFERNQFVHLKKSVIVVQRRFRTNMAMRIERAKFQELKQATLVLQSRYRAHRAKAFERNQFVHLKKSVIVVQRRFRANMAMRIERAKFQELKQATLVLQSRYRAHTAKLFERHQFVHLKKSVIVVQRRFRANMAMRIERAKFQELKQATLVLQSRYRAHRAKAFERNQFVQLKKSAIMIQRRFRANMAMRVERAKFQQLKQATLVLQSRYRAHTAKLFERHQFVHLKKSVIVVQRRFRANMAMRIERAKFQELKQATLVLQSRYRAHRAKAFERNQFVQLKKSAIMIQRRFRANMAMRVERAKFQQLKQATLVLQSCYRAHSAKVFERNQFLNLKKSVIIIQRKFRANKVKVIKLSKLDDLRNAAIIIQRWYRKTKATSVDRTIFLNFKRLRYNSVLKIQALWRGYRCRQEHPEISNIRKNAMESTLKAIPYNTLAHRRERAVQMLISDKPTLLQIIHALSDLEFITRRCKDTCLQMSRLLPEQLYITISSTNRSPAEMQACTVATSILINFCKYRLTSSAAWLPQYIDSVITVMSHCCDKEESLFSYLCTLIWLFAHNQEYKNFILSIPCCSQKINKIKSLCLRKEKMVSKRRYKTESFFMSYGNLPLPTLLPDWGLDHPDRPKTFTNSLHGLNCMLKILDFE